MPYYHTHVRGSSSGISHHRAASIPIPALNLNLPSTMFSHAPSTHLPPSTPDVGKKKTYNSSFPSFPPSVFCPLPAAGGYSLPPTLTRGEHVHHCSSGAELMADGIWLPQPRQALFAGVDVSMRDVKVEQGKVRWLTAEWASCSHAHVGQMLEGFAFELRCVCSARAEIQG
jgi:hypothetical protein